MTDSEEVYNFWEAESCGERHAVGHSSMERFQAEDALRYKLEPFILEFASFNDFKGLDVLEIGVGFGADHVRIARSRPRLLVGVDLTERAIQHTTDRLKLYELESHLKVDNAESLSFEDETFDAVYSWGVLHHSRNTQQCFQEVYRVLKPDGFAKVMIYHKHAPVGWMLWLRYGLLRLRPFVGLKELYSKYLESPGTKAYSVGEARRLCGRFSHFDVSLVLSSADLLEVDAGARHEGLLLNVARVLCPRPLIRLLSRIVPIGLFMLITVKK